jgi:hypothetical protein
MVGLVINHFKPRNERKYVAGKLEPRFLKTSKPLRMTISRKSLYIICRSVIFEKKIALFDI